MSVRLFRLQAEWVTVSLVRPTHAEPTAVAHQLLLPIRRIVPGLALDVATLPHPFRLSIYLLSTDVYLHPAFGILLLERVFADVVNN